MAARNNSGADEVIYIPTQEIIEESATSRLYLPNEQATYETGGPHHTPRPKKRSTKKGGWRMEEGEAAANFYDGFGGFVVRTALIRADSFDPLEAPQITNFHVLGKLVDHLAYADQEHMVSIAVNTQNRLLAIHETAIGGTSGAGQQFKHIAKVAFLTSASAMFMVHNHPGGLSKPSEDDVVLTKEVQKGLKCIGIPLLDHLIIARDGFYSFANAGIL